MLVSRSDPDCTMNRAVLAIALVLTALALCPIWVNTFVPLQDYSYHLLRAYVAVHFDDPSFRFNEQFVLSFYPEPYIFSDLLLFLLGHVFDMATAGKLVLSMYILLLPWSVLYLVRSVSPKNTAICLFAFPFIYSWFFNMGFLSFFFSIPFFLLTTGYWYRHGGAADWRHRTLFSFLIFLVYLNHLYTFLFLVPTVLMLTVLHAGKRQSVFEKIRTLSNDLLLFLPSFVLLCGSFALAPSEYSDRIEPVYLLFPGIKQKLRLALDENMRYFISYSPRLEKALFRCVGILYGILALRYWKRTIQSPFLGVASVLVLMYLCCPTWISPSYNYISCRILIFCVFVSLPVLSFPEKVLYRWSLTVVMTIISVASLAVTMEDHRRINGVLKELHEAIDQIPAGSRVLFRFDKAFLWREGSVTPYAFFGAYYYLEKGVGEVPALGPFVGRMRFLRYKNEAQSTQLEVENRMHKVLAGEWFEYLKLGGILLVLDDAGIDLESMSRHYGYKLLSKAGKISFYQRVEIVTDPQSAQKDYSFKAAGDANFIFFCPGNSDARESQPSGFNMIFSNQYVQLFQKAPTSKRVDDVTMQ